MDAYKPRRLRITEPGLDNYNGLFGMVEFVEGVSVHQVGWQEAARLGANVRVVDYDEPERQVGPVSDYERIKHTTADAPMVKAMDTGIFVDGEIKSATQRFTRAELEDIADKQGLAGVRAIANAVGRTGRSIAQCVDAVLEAQGDNPHQSTIEGPGEKV